MYNEAIDKLRIACEQQDIIYTSQISSLTVVVGQQQIKIKRLEEQLVDAQKIVTNNLDIIIGLHERIGELDTFAQEGWDLAETYSLEISEKASNPEGEEKETPPYPYTHPIREMALHSKVR